MYYLVADMRLQCYTAEWTVYSIYCAVMIGLYVGGLPVVILALLYRSRRTLFGPDSAVTMKRLGFLYDVRGVIAVDVPV